MSDQDLSLDDMRGQSLGRLLLNAHRAYAERFIHLISSAGYGTGITMAHINTIVFIPTTGIRISELAEHTHMTKQAVGQFVQELEQIGLLERTTDPKDRRAAIVRFTDQGLRIMQDSLLIKEQIETEFRDLIGESQYGVLIEALQTFLHGNK